MKGIDEIKKENKEADKKEIVQAILNETNELLDIGDEQTIFITIYELKKHVYKLTKERKQIKKELMEIADDPEALIDYIKHM